MTALRLAAIRLPGPAEPWEALGFAVGADRRIAVANGAVEVGAEAPSLAIGGLVEPAVVDGLALVPGTFSVPTDHANTAYELDHLVIVTDSLDRTCGQVDQVLGLPRRRVRETETVRQGFHRFPDRGCVVEVVEPRRPPRAVALFGVVFNLIDVDTFATTYGPGLVGEVHPAVQPGRRIASIRRDAGLPVPVAVMSPEP